MCTCSIFVCRHKNNDMSTLLGHAHTYIPTDRQTDTQAYIHKSIQTYSYTYTWLHMCDVSPLWGGGGGEPGGAGSYIYIYIYISVFIYTNMNHPFPIFLFHALNFLRRSLGLQTEARHCLVEFYDSGWCHCEYTGERQEPIKPPWSCVEIFVISSGG